MANEALQKVAVLTGLTMVIGGAEISQSSAATMTQTQSATFNFSLFGEPMGGGATSATATPPPSFLAFDSSKGILTEVDVILDSTLHSPASTTATLTLGPFTITHSGTTFGSVPFDQTVTSTSAGALAQFLTPQNASLVLAVGPSSCEPNQFCASWASDAPTSLTLNYLYNPTNPAVPLPGALPLFATGLAGLGLLALHHRRKQNRTLAS